MPIPTTPVLKNSDAPGERPLTCALRRKPWAAPFVIVSETAQSTELNLKGTRVGDYNISGTTRGS